MIPTIETERLILRPLRVEDAEHIFNTWTSDPRVTKYMIYSTHKTVDETKEWILRTLEGYKTGKCCEYGFQLKETGKLIGSGGADMNEKDDQSWTIGYNIAYDYWHQGYTTEAMEAIVDFLSKEKGIKHFTSDHAVDNPYSGKVIEKIGMKFDHMGSYTNMDGVQFEAKFYILDLD